MIIPVILPLIDQGWGLAKVAMIMNRIMKFGEQDDQGTMSLLLFCFLNHWLALQPISQGIPTLVISACAADDVVAISG